MNTTAPSPPRGLLFKACSQAGFLGTGEQLGYLRADGTGMRLFDFGRPSEIGWGAYDFAPDGRALLLSIETDPSWKTESFYVYYPRSRTHLWLCNLETGTIEEIATRPRPAPFCAPCALLPRGQGLLATFNIEGREVLHRLELDGANPVPLTGRDEYVYGVSLSPDGSRVAYHANYQIHTMHLDGTGRVQVSQLPGQLCFGTSWSPDGDWVLYQVCNSAQDPAHDWSSIWIGRPDGSENRQLTGEAEAWFGAAYGPRDNPRTGSIMPRWAPDGSGILYARRQPGSQVPWEFQPQRPDTTHHNRDFKPELARGGTQICLLDPQQKTSTPLTPSQPATWELRPDWSPDSARILCCHAPVDELPAVWMMNRDGSDLVRLTDAEGRGADFPRWVPAQP
ncbi:MAG: serine/threonine protein kinase [Candidatus Latescibacteria bacterium]|nr:serine/threonine protein kinase [Candidatus Latescibacterota bacterium]